MSDFNGSFLGVRESSNATSEFVRDYAVQRANEKSENSEIDQFFIVFNSKEKSFGLAFSDGLKSSLGFDQSYYDLVSGDGDSNSDGLYPSSGTFPDQSELSVIQESFLSSFQSSLSEYSERYKTELESYSDKAISDKILEIDISDKLNAVDNKLTDALSSIEVFLAAELEGVSLSENEKIAEMQDEISSLKQQLADKQSSDGLTEEQVVSLIEQSNSNDTGLGADEVMLMINERLDTFSMDANDPANI